MTPKIQQALDNLVSVIREETLTEVFATLGRFGLNPAGHTPESAGLNGHASPWRESSAPAVTTPLGFIKLNPGCGNPDIAAALGLTSTQTTNALTYLRRVGKIHRIGAYRSARWYPVKS